MHLFVVKQRPMSGRDGNEIAGTRQPSFLDSNDQVVIAAEQWIVARIVAHGAGDNAEFAVGPRAEW